MPAAPAPPSPPIETGFDPLVFWVQHRQKVVLLGTLLIAGLVIYFASELLRTRKLASAAQQLAAAKDAEGFRRVISDNKGTAAAGDAHLLLAEQLRKEGKLDEAATTLRSFIENYGEHSLISGAWTSLAVTQEAQGKQDEALSTYQKVTTTYATSFSAPIALLAQARIFKEKGKADEAKRLYDQVISQHQGTSFARRAMQENQPAKKQPASESGGPKLEPAAGTK